VRSSQFKTALQGSGTSQAGLYALERLAQSNSRLRQTIVNVICAYLRMPFTLPATARKPDPADIGWQEREVRLTAQAILAAHLQPGPDGQHQLETFWAGIDLDLTGATLINLDLGHCRIRAGKFTDAEFAGFTGLAGAKFGGATDFVRATFDGDVWFGQAEFAGSSRFGAAFAYAKFNGSARFDGAEFAGNASFARAKFAGNTEFTRAKFAANTRFDGAEFAGNAWFDGARFDLGVPPVIAQLLLADTAEPADEDGGVDRPDVGP